MVKKACKECGKDFTSRQYTAEFCGGPCRAASNNRRMRRGAVLYDLMMIERADPAAFKRHDLDGRAEELIAHWRTEDEAVMLKRTWKCSLDVMYDTLAMLR